MAMNPSSCLPLGTLPAGPCSLGDDCRAKNNTRQARYKCMICGDGLHALFCTVSVGDNGEVECPAGLGCKESRIPASTAGSAIQPHIDLLMKITGQAAAQKIAPKKKAQDLKMKNDGGRKRGPKHGTKRTERSKDYWFGLCASFKDNHSNMTMKSFLQSQHSGSSIDGKKSDCVSFARYVKLYESGKLKPSQSLREYAPQFPEIEARLIGYIRARQRLYGQDKLGASWDFLRQKLLQWANLEQDEKYNNFASSSGFLANCLKRHGIVGLELLKEGKGTDNSEHSRLINANREEIKDLIRKYNIAEGSVYNGNQSIFFYNKLPGKVYEAYEARKTHKDEKQTTSKDRTALMLCVAADGTKVPLFVVGKAEMPKCFGLCENGKPPLPYLHQKNACFDKTVFLHWINHVFWPHHQKTNGDAHCLLVLSNLSQQDLEGGALPAKLHLIYLPPDATSSHPCDMGITASLKAGYMCVLLSSLLSLFEDEGGFHHAAEQRRMQPVGCKGLAYGGRATLLDSMNILDGLWNESSKYAPEDSIRRCWRKADILPISWNQYINYDLGRASESTAKNQISTEILYELCGLMQSLRMKANASQVDYSKGGYALANSFCSEEVADGELSLIANHWVDFDESEAVLEVEVDEELDKMGKGVKLQNDQHEIDDDPMVLEAGTDEEERSNIPTFFEAEDMIARLIQYCRSNAMSDDDRCLIENFGQRLRNHRLGVRSAQSVRTNFSKFLSRTERANNNAPAAASR